MMVHFRFSTMSAWIGLAALSGMTCFGTPSVLADGGEGEVVVAKFQATGTIVLKDNLKAGDFLLLKDVTPLKIVGGHVAMKVPCRKNGETPLQILAGSASERGSALVPVELEFIEDISSPGGDCVYHADLDVETILSDILVATGRNDVDITDIALSNGSDRQVKFGSDNGNTVTVTLLTDSGNGHDHD